MGLEVVMDVDERSALRMPEKTTPLYVVCSARRCIGKTLVSRLLTEFYFVDDRPVSAFDLADEGPQLVDYLPDTTSIVDIGDIRGQMAFFDRLITDNHRAKIVDIGHRASKNFFAIAQEIRFFEEACQHSIEPLILFIGDSDPESAKTYTMLRHQFSGASSLLPVRNQIDASPIGHRGALPEPNMAPASLDIPFLNLSLRALVEQHSFSFSGFWRAPPSNLPASIDDELSTWVELIFYQFRNLGLFFGWEDLSTSTAFNRSQRLRSIHRGDNRDTQPRGISSAVSLNEASLELPEQVLRFAPKKVRNVGSFHPARTALRAAIAELEAAKARHHQVVQAEQRARESHIASERILALLGQVDQTVAQQGVEREKSTAIDEPFRDQGSPYDVIARQAVREKSRDRARATEAAYKSLSADLSHAELVVWESGQKVVTAAIEVLIAEGFRQANALEAAWNEVWRQYDWLSALSDCELRHTAGSHPLKLAPEIVKLMETIAAVDRRRFPAGHNHAAAHAGELWCRWFEALLTNAEAEAPFVRDYPAIGTDSR
jgi:hypothetical protein